MYERLPGSSGRRRFLLITFMIAIAGAVVGMGAMQAGAVDPIVDFKTYPPALPASCAADGNTSSVDAGMSPGPSVLPDPGVGAWPIAA